MNSVRPLRVLTCVATYRMKGVQIMTLLTSTRLAIASLICTYLLRLVGTAMPSAFRVELVAAGATGLHLVCGVAMLLFFIQFLTQYVQRSRVVLRHATYWAVAGAALNPLLAFKTLILIVDPYSLPKAVRSPTVDAVLPAVGSVLLLAFFVKLRENLLLTEQRALQKSATAATLGFTVLFALQTTVLLNFLAAGSFGWLLSYSTLVTVGMIPIITLAVLAILSFFVSFHRHLTCE